MVTLEVEGENQIENENNDEKMRENKEPIISTIIVENDDFLQHNILTEGAVAKGTSIDAL